MKQKSMVILSVITLFTIIFTLCGVNVQAATTLTANATGTIDGYNYEYWKDNGTGTMTLNGGGTFSCSWSNINNILFRTGKKLGSTKTYQDYGNISINYSCNYQPNGNSYMAVYGWTEDPLVEYYIIDSYGTWKPPGNGIAMKGTINVDGRTYEVYQNSRTGPSIKGNNTTFQQYWSICTSKRTSGTISVSEHFKAWEAKGMKMGKMYEVSMVVEGYQSSGKADMTKMDLNIGGSPPSPIPYVNTSKPLVTSNGDFNGDGFINMSDIMLLATKFNTVSGDGKYAVVYDLNNDGSINMSDIMIIATNFGKSVSVATSTSYTTTTKVPVATPTQVTSGKFHCFLLLGQSNMAGWPSPQSSDKVTDSRILALGYYNNQWAVSCPPLHDAGGLGPGDWFAKTIIDKYPAGDSIGLIPCAISGEKIETFMKSGGSKYDWIISRAKLAQQKGGIIDGILLHQGESNNGQSDWPNKVNTLITDIKKDLGLGDIPVLAGELLYSGGCAGHNTLVNKLPSVVKNCYVVSASGLSGDAADSWKLHFNHDSQVTFGKRYAEKMIQVLGLSGSISTPTPVPSSNPSSNPNAKLLALTFDDGPDNTLTAKVLDKLDKYKVPATFMMIGQKVNNGTAPIIKRIVDSGHEIGNHSWGYDSMGGLTASAIKDSISKTNSAISQYAGVTPKFFRAPNLAYSQTLYDSVDLTFVQGITCNDWSTSTSAQQRADAILNGAKDGTIILLHDVQPLPHPTPEALDILIPKLQSQGYEFVTLSELFRRKGVSLRSSDNVAHTTLPN